MKPQSIDQAEAIALRGLQHLASEDDLLMRFSALTGILPNDMRSAATQPGFLVGVLDFFLSHEPDLLVFAEQEGLRPESIAEARNTLSPETFSSSD